MFSPAQIRQTLHNVLASPQFVGSERMSRFLRFAVESQLSGRENDLKEYTIGVEVFDRTPDYDPRIDPIVRVEARRLRTKLKAYFQAAGTNTALVIDLPKGSYVPVYAQPSTPHRDAQAVVDRSISILPFDNATHDREADYLSDGLTQQIIHRLTRVEGLRVAGWNSAARMRERRDLHEVARELNTESVLAGSVRSGSGRLRITAQLFDAASHRFIWSEVYDRPLQDLLSVEEDIAGAIVGALQVHFGLASEPAGSAEAYQLYFKGRYYWNKRTYQGLQRALEFFRQALDCDPGFALAWAGLGDTYLLLTEYGPLQPERVVETARSAIQQALRLAPQLGEAEASLALIRCLHDWKWADAERHFHRAMHLSPGYATAFYWYGIDYCALRGLFVEAAAALDQALALDPLSSIIREGRGYLKLLTHQYDAAISEYRSLVDLDPGFSKFWTSMGRVYIQSGDYSKALASLEKGASLLGAPTPSIIGAMGQAHGMSGDLEAARQCLAHLTAAAVNSHVPASAFASIHIGLKDCNSAIESLRRGAEHRDFSIAGIGVHPLYDPLRDSADFNVLIERVGCLP